MAKGKYIKYCERGADGCYNMLNWIATPIKRKQLNRKSIAVHNCAQLYTLCTGESFKLCRGESLHLTKLIIGKLGIALGNLPLDISYILLLVHH